MAKQSLQKLRDCCACPGLLTGALWYAAATLLTASHTQSRRFEREMAATTSGEASTVAWAGVCLRSCTCSDKRAHALPGR